MYHHTRDYGQKGAVIGAISGVDIALWDICGKVRERAGGAGSSAACSATKVEAYATGFYRIKGQGEAPRLAQEFETHCANGFRALKIKLGFGIEDDLAVMRSRQEAWPKAPGGDDRHQPRLRRRRGDPPRARARGHGLAAALVRGAGGAGRPRRLRRGAPRARHADRRRRERVHAVRLQRATSRNARWTSLNPTSASPAASPAAATSSRSRTRTACR